MPFNQIKKNFQIGRNGLFSFFQIRDFIKKETLLTDTAVSDIVLFCNLACVTKY